jgi:hypothetical protein
MKSINLNSMSDNDSKAVFEVSGTEQVKHYQAKVSVYKGHDQVSEGSYFSSDDLDELKKHALACAQDEQDAYPLNEGENILIEYREWSESAEEYHVLENVKIWPEIKAQ